MLTIPLLSLCFLLSGNTTLFPKGPSSAQLDLLSTTKQRVLIRQERGTVSFRNASHPARVRIKNK